MTDDDTTEQDTPSTNGNGSDNGASDGSVPGNGSGTAVNEGGPAAEAAPSMRIMAQYLKDLSFESPGAPQSLMSSDNSPAIDISVNVNAHALSETDYEVELDLEAKAMNGETPVFVAELQYAGIFRLENIPQETMHPVVLIECPRMLFPFARHILADATRNGGFPPLMIDPIDFAGMYNQRVGQESDAGTA